MPWQFHEKNSLKIALKFFFNMFLMNFQRLEFSDDIQPMFVSVMADEVSYWVLSPLTDFLQCLTFSYGQY